MTSKIKVDNINKVSDDSNIINRCGTTVTVGSAPGNFRAGTNNVQASDGGNLISQCGTTITLGASGDTVALASGASQTGFGNPGTVIDWQTGAIKTATFTGVAEKGYFCNTSGGAFSCNLPAGSAGDAIAFNDYADSFNSNNLTLVPNGSDKINGVAQNAKLSSARQSVTLIFIDSTRGWKTVQDSDAEVTGTSGFVQATGGNTTITCGDYKTHVFTAPGTFCVTDRGLPSGSNTLEHLVVAGGGAGNKAGYGGGGGGGGGFRTNYPSPATAGLAIPAGGAYAITVGGGVTCSPSPAANSKGSSSSIGSLLVSAGGGAGSGGGSASCSNKGGSGGGAGGAYNGGPAVPTTGAAGNTPPVSPPQGNNGGNGRTGVGGCAYYGGGGGGAGAVGANNPGPANGGDGSPMNPTMVGPTAPSYGTPGPAPGRYFSGGGGGQAVLTSSNGSGGAGGGTAGLGPSGSGTTCAGGTTTGGGSGGGGGYPTSYCTGNGGSGIVIIRYKFQ